MGILLDEEEVISQAHIQTWRKLNIKYGEKTSKWGEGIWERCGPKLSGLFFDVANIAKPNFDLLI